MNNENFVNDVSTMYNGLNEETKKLVIDEFVEDIIILFGGLNEEAKKKVIDEIYEFINWALKELHGTI